MSITANIVISILIVIVIVALCFWLYYRGHKDVVKKIILACVVQAEKALGSGTGELKYAMVVDKIYEKLPFIITFFVNKKELNDLIEAAVKKLKDILSDGTTLQGYEDELLFNNANMIISEKELAEKAG